MAAGDELAARACVVVVVGELIVSALAKKSETAY